MNNNTEQKILTAVVDIQQRLGSVENDITYLKESHDRTFRRIDDFLSTLGRHETELAALRSSRERLEERIVKLETAVGV
jgi:chromosome segregation ATPase